MKRKWIAMMLLLTMLIPCGNSIKAETAEESIGAQTEEEASIERGEKALEALGLDYNLVGNPNSNLYIDQFLGANEIPAHLKTHRHDEFYRTTVFQGNWNTKYGTSLPKGLDPKGVGGMNCSGFVSAVFRNSGADLDKIIDASGDGWRYINVTNWEYTVMVRGIRVYQFESMDEALASGKLRKGDVMFFHPHKDSVDPHTAIFWGATSDQNIVWHSIPMGNAIGHYTPEDMTVFVYPLYRNRLPEIKDITVENYSTGAKLTWGRVKKAKGYMIYRKTEDDYMWHEYAKVGATATTYQDRASKVGVTYRYAVAAIDSNGVPGEFNYTGYAGGKAPTFKLCKAYSDGVHLNWYKVGNTAGYKIYRRESGSSTWTMIKTVKGGSVQNYTDTKAKKGKVYLYKVKAYTSSGRLSLAQKSLKARAL